MSVQRRLASEALSALGTAVKRLLVVDEADVIVEKSRLGELAPAGWTEADLVLILLVVPQVDEEPIVVRESLFADLAAMRFDLLVMGLRVLDHELHGWDRLRAVDAVHLPRVHDILMRREMLVQQVLVEVNVGAESANQTLRLIQLLIHVRHVDAEPLGVEKFDLRVLDQVLASHVFINVVLGLQDDRTDIAVVADVSVLAELMALEGARIDECFIAQLAKVSLRVSRGLRLFY